MGETCGDIYLALILLGKDGAYPVAEIRGAQTNVHRHVEYFSSNHAAQLALGMAELIVQSA